MHGSNLGDCIGREVDLMVNQMDLGVQVEETEVSRVSAGAERDDLLRRGRIGFKKLGDQKINCRSANIGSCTGQPRC